MDKGQAGYLSAFVGMQCGQSQGHILLWGWFFCSVCVRACMRACMWSSQNTGAF